MSEIIQTKIDSVRRKHGVVRAGHGVAWMVILFACVLLATMAIDYFLDLPYVLRAAMLALHLTALLFLLLRWVIWPLIKGPDDETVALMIESFYPDSASRIISAVQFSRVDAIAGASPLMVIAAVREAESYIEPKETRDVVAAGDLVRKGSWALGLIVAAAAIVLFTRPSSGALLMRAFCVPGVDVPRSTRVELETPLKRIVAKGDSIQIAAFARGTVPSEGTLRVTYQSGATSEFPIKPDSETPERFVINIENVQDTFRYRVHLNDGRSDEAIVESHARPEVAGVVLRQHFPAYTKLPPAERSKNDLTLLAGSRLQVRVTASKPLKDSVSLDGPRSRLEFEGSNVTYYLTRDAGDFKSAITAENNAPTIPVPAGTTGLTLHLVDELGLESKSAAVYPIQLVDDAAPSVEIIEPTQREELVTDRAGTKITYQVDDDFGIASIKLRHMLGTSDTQLQGDGLAAQYFNNEALEGKPFVERIDKQVNFDTTEALVKGLKADGFSVRWTGKILPTQSGAYVFGSSPVDDGVRMWIGEQLILDKFDRNQRAIVTSEPIVLEAGKMVDVRIEYREASGQATLCFAWTGPDGVNEIVPTANLFSSDPAAVAAQLKRIKTIDLPLAQAQRSVRGQYDWDLSALRLTSGQVIEWWIEATDNNNQTGPGVTESERRTIRVGTEAEVRQYLLQRLGNPLQDIRDVQDRQVEEASKLGEVFKNPPRE